MHQLTKLDEPAFIIAAGRLRGMDSKFLAPYFVKLIKKTPDPTYQDGQTLGLNDLVLLCQMQNYLSGPPLKTQDTHVRYAQALLDGIKAGDEVAFAEWGYNHPEASSSRNLGYATTASYRGNPYLTW
jgi:hypothetical protein